MTSKEWKRNEGGRSEEEAERWQRETETKKVGKIKEGVENDVHVFRRHKLHDLITCIERPNVHPSIVAFLLTSSASSLFSVSPSQDTGSPLPPSASYPETLTSSPLASAATDLQIVVVLSLLELHIRGREHKLEHDLA